MKTSRDRDSQPSTINHQPSTVLPATMVRLIQQRIGGEPATEEAILRFISARYGARSLFYLPPHVAAEICKRPEDFIRAAEQYCQPELAL